MKNAITITTRFKLELYYDSLAEDYAHLAILGTVARPGFARQTEEVSYIAIVKRPTIWWAINDSV